jgi:predicted PurR-regulated permease PerM
MHLNITHIKNIVLVLLATSLIILFMYVLQPVLVPLIIACLLAFLLFPAYKKLTEWRFPKILAAAICVLASVLLGLGLAAILIWQLTGFANDFDLIKANFTSSTNNLLTWVEANTHYTKSEQTAMLQKRFNESVSNFTGYAFSAVNAVLSVILSGTLIAIYTFLLLIYHQKFNRILALIIKDEEKLAASKEVITAISQVGKFFLKGTVMDVIIISILSAIGFLIIGLKQAVFLGILLAVLNIIPYVGATLGAVIPMMVGLIYNNDWKIGLAAVGVCIVVQFIDNNFVMPKVVGNSVSINPLFSTLALITGFLLWGIAGMILSIPLMGIFKVICDHVEELKPLGYLLSEKD